MYENPFLSHKRCPAFDPAELQTLARRFYLQLGAGYQVEPFPERLRHDDSTGPVDGNDHGTMV